MRKLPRTMMQTWRIRQLKDQGGVCPVCNLPIDLSVKGEGVVDHDHITGEIRGVLHRSCNGALGKVDNAAGRWGAKSMQTEAILGFLERMIQYYRAPGTGLMYHTHVSEDEKRLKRNAKARESRARTVANAKLRNLKKDS